MKLLSGLEVKSITGASCVCHMPNGLVASFKLFDGICADFCCKTNKANSWHNYHRFWFNGQGNCTAPIENPVAVTEFVEPQPVPEEIKLTVTEVAQPIIAQQISQ